jgi:hypothetical protein
MVDFDLSGAHPDYRRDVPEILLPLASRYPGARLRSVSLYVPKPGDTSMAATYPGGDVRLNSHWFARDPAHLAVAALHLSVVDVGGFQVGWHGPMVREPEHLLTHEFGHVVWQSLPQRVVEEWAGDRWRASTRDPQRSPGGYALAHDPPEFFGEMFALVDLGFATDDEVSDMMDLIGGLR